MKTFIDNLIGLLGLALMFAGSMLIMSILPWMDWIDCALYAGMIVIAVVGLLGMFADDFIHNPQPTAFQPQQSRAGLLLRLEIPRFSLTLAYQGAI